MLPHGVKTPSTWVFTTYGTGAGDSRVFSIDYDTDTKKKGLDDSDTDFETQGWAKFDTDSDTDTKTLQML